MEAKCSLSWRKQLCILSCKWRCRWSCPTSLWLFVMVVSVWLVSDKTQDIHILLHEQACMTCLWLLNAAWLDQHLCLQFPAVLDGWTLPIWVGEPCQSGGWTLPIWWVNPANLMSELYQSDGWTLPSIGYRVSIPDCSWNGAGWWAIWALWQVLEALVAIEVLLLCFTINKSYSGVDTMLVLIYDIIPIDKLHILQYCFNCYGRKTIALP